MNARKLRLYDAAGHIGVQREGYHSFSKYVQLKQQVKYAQLPLEQHSHVTGHLTLNQDLRVSGRMIWALPDRLLVGYRSRSYFRHVRQVQRKEEGF